MVDPTSRRITVEDRNRLGSTTWVIAFDDVLDVGPGYLGTASNGVTFYYLALTLRGGETYSLFAPGRFYQGSSGRAVVGMWKARLEAYLEGRPLAAV